MIMTTSMLSHQQREYTRMARQSYMTRQAVKVLRSRILAATNYTTRVIPAHNESERASECEARVNYALRYRYTQAQACWLASRHRVLGSSYRRGHKRTRSFTHGRFYYWPQVVYRTWDL